MAIYYHLLDDYDGSKLDESFDLASEADTIASGSDNLASSIVTRETSFVLFGESPSLASEDNYIASDSYKLAISSTEAKKVFYYNFGVDTYFPKDSSFETTQLITQTIPDASTYRIGVQQVQFDRGNEITISSPLGGVYFSPNFDGIYFLGFRCTLDLIGLAATPGRAWIIGFGDHTSPPLTISGGREYRVDSDWNSDFITIICEDVFTLAVGDRIAPLIRKSATGGITTWCYADEDTAFYGRRIV